MNAIWIAGLLLAQAAHQHHPPQSAGEYAKILEDPARDAWQKPHEVVAALGLRPADAIADIGSGSGYFARRFARHTAKVYAVDIDAALLKLSAANAPSNLETILAEPNNPKLPRASVDVIFFCDVIHHIENRVAYYEKLKAALRPGGRVVIVDFFKKELPVGPPPSMKLTEQDVQKEFEQAGFRLTRKHDPLPYQYFLEFQR